MTEYGMSPLLAELVERIVTREDLELEFKRSEDRLPKTIWDTVSAFANTNGGWIVLGIDDRTHPPDIVGVRNAPQVLQDFYNGIRNRQKISHNACGPNDASIEPVGDRDVIVVRIPAAPRRHRPVYINNHPYDGTFVRGYTGDYRCSKQDVDRMMREASSDAADSTILPQLTLEDLDADTLRRYRRLYQTQEPGSPWNAYDDLGFLRVLRAFARDRETGKEGLTVAGLLMFGTPLVIREWRSPHRIDYRMTQDASDARWDDRVLHEGNLLSAFEAIYPKLVHGLPTPFRLEGGRRVDEGPMQTALREALVNLLVHADYAETAASLITRSPEGFRFRNPGTSRVPESDLFLGNRSEPRNPELVHMFRLIGLAEEAGSGIPQILRAWQSLGLQLPNISVGTERYEFEIVLRHAHLLAEEDRAWLAAVSDELEEPERLALVQARHAGHVDNRALRALTGLHPADVTKILGGLRNRGLLEMTGGGRGSRYELGLSAIKALPKAGAVASASSNMSEPNSDMLEPSSDIYVDGSTSVQQELWQLSAEVRERYRVSPSMIDEVLIKLCSIQALTLPELASLTNKKPRTLRESVRRLILAGSLAYLYADKPTHPSQKYVAVLKPNEEARQLSLINNVKQDQ